MLWQLLFVFIKLRKVCLRHCYTTQAIRFAICVTIYLCWTNLFSLSVTSKGKGRPDISFVRFCDLKEQVCLKIQMSQSVYTFPKNSLEKNSTDKLIRLVSRRFRAFQTSPLTVKKKGFQSRGNLNFFVYDTYISMRTTQWGKWIDSQSDMFFT